MPAIHAATNELVVWHHLKVAQDSSYECTLPPNEGQVVLSKVFEAFKNEEERFYPPVLRKLTYSPHFLTIEASMTAFKNYVLSSKAYFKLNIIAFCCCAVLLLLGLVRIITGWSTDKSFSILLLIIVLLTIVTYYFLKNLSNSLFENILPQYFQKEQIPAGSQAENMQWKYLRLGNAVLTASFVPLVSYVNHHNKDSETCGTSCGSNCGSSCGSGCGGCGGD